MKAILCFSLRHFYATIIYLLALLIHDAVEVGGFQNNQLQCRSRIGIPTSADAVTNWNNPVISYATTYGGAIRTNNKHKTNRMQRTILAMAVPTLDRWKIISTGSVIGTVRNHPAIADGDVITTSPIQDPNTASRQSTITTMSGSKYRLLEPRGEISPAAKQREAAALAAALAEADANDRRNNNYNAQPAQASALSSVTSEKKSNFFGGWGGPFKKAGEGVSVNDSSSGSSANDDDDETSEVRRKEILRSSPQWEEAARKYKLNGDTIGLEDEYLLASKPERSTSGKSNIWEAYKTDESTGLPKNNAYPVCMKISTNLEAISREYENYRKLSFLGIWETGRFVRCYEFFPVAGYDKRFRTQCALAMEKGSRDLKAFLNSKGKLENKELKDACVSATQCVQALHNAGLVWTDMKTENFVVMPSGAVKGIDLESAMPIGDYPVDYSPEACPPEFAKAFLEGDGPYFELGTSYDVWSLGMLMLELSTGRGYFDGKTPAQITKQLRDMDDEKMARDLDESFGECDERLRDLIRRCLQTDCRKRPNTAQILMHPYFLAGNPFAFLGMNV